MVHYITYSISLIILWSLLLLNLNRPGLLGIFIALAYTFYSAYIIRCFVEQETRNLMIVKFISPVFFLALFFYAQTFSFCTFFYTFLSPISIAFLLFCVAAFSKDNFPKKEVQFFVIAFIYVYSFSLYNIWDKALLQEIRSNSYAPYDFEIKGEALDKDIPSLPYYQFLNSNLDSIKLSGTNEYVIIETWNEKCIPCFKAMEEMADFYGNIESKTNQYYIYIPTKNNLDYTKIFSFEKIQDKSNILVDINLQKDALLKGYPVFLVFNKVGELVYKETGYSTALKNKIQKNILNALSER